MPNHNGKKNKSYRHGMSGTRIYNIWGNMIQRCTNQTHIAYKRYGGKGVMVCKRWRNFVLFYEDMGKLYNKHIKKFGLTDTTLDRIDGNGDYELSNCRWATYKVQSTNHPNFKGWEHKGVLLSLTDWKKATGINPSNIYYFAKRRNKPHTEIIKDYLAGKMGRKYIVPSTP